MNAAPQQIRTEAGERPGPFRYPYQTRLEVAVHGTRLARPATAAHAASTKEQMQALEFARWVTFDLASDSDVGVSMAAAELRALGKAARQKLAQLKKAKPSKRMERDS